MKRPSSRKRPVSVSDDDDDDANESRSSQNSRIGPVRLKTPEEIQDQYPRVFGHHEPDPSSSSTTTPEANVSEKPLSPESTGSSTTPSPSPSRSNQIQNAMTGFSQFSNPSSLLASKEALSVPSPPDVQSAQFVLWQRQRSDSFPTLLPLFPAPQDSLPDPQPNQSSFITTPSCSNMPVNPDSPSSKVPDPSPTNQNPQGK